MLGHQLPKPSPPFAISGAPSTTSSPGSVARPLSSCPEPSRPRTTSIPTWVAPRAITSWHRGFPFRTDPLRRGQQDEG